MLKQYIIFVAIHCFSLTGSIWAQKEDYNWRFDYKRGLNFNSGNPVVVNGSPMDALESCTAISDASGSLLFYTNGGTIWNKNNVMMTNGNLSNPTGTATQLVAIPYPGKCRQYILFYFSVGKTGWSMPPGELNYAVIDMNLSGGLGAVPTGKKDMTIVDDTLSEKLMAVPHSNGTDWWVIYHDAIAYNGVGFSGGLTFYVLKVTSAGVMPAIPQVIGDTIWNPTGEMEISRDGSKIACVDLSGVINVLDFDRSTGLLSNSIVLNDAPIDIPNSTNSFYGCAFSPNGRYLYVGENMRPTIYQYDLQAANIKASKTTVYNSTKGIGIYALQLGPDGKIYFALSNYGLGAINNPDAAGMGCNAALTTLYPANTNIMSLPTYPNYSLASPSGSSIMQAHAGNDTTLCPGDSLQLAVQETGTYSWTPSAGLSCTNCQNPVANPASNSTYIVTVTDPGGCILKDTVNIAMAATINAIASPATASICAGDSVALQASGGSTYSWLPAATISAPTSPSTFASPTTNTTYTVTVSSGSCPPDTAMVTVNVSPGITALASPMSASICAGDSLQLFSSGGTSYQWLPATGLNNPSIASPIASPTATTTYSVTVGSGSCPPDTALITVQVVASITANAGNDQSICNGQSASLQASGGSSYSWSSGQNTSSISVNPATTTTYTVVVFSGSCQPDTDMVTVHVHSSPTAGIIGDSILQIGNSVTLSASGGNFYSWQPATSITDPASTNIVVSPTSTTTYTVIVSDVNGCKDTATFTVTVTDNCTEPFWPNIFSPNNDGVNDEFLVKAPCITYFSLIIVDRWGRKVFETNDPAKGWDGNYNGQVSNTAVFDYILHIEQENGKSTFASGSISIIK